MMVASANPIRQKTSRSPTTLECSGAGSIDSRDQIGLQAGVPAENPVSRDRQRWRAWGALAQDGDVIRAVLSIPSPQDPF